jgi:inner membrane protein
VLSDLRMGAEPDYSFRFVVAERDGTGWRAYGPEQAQWPWEAGRRLSAMWDRIWTRPQEELQAIAAGAGVVPAQAAAANSGETPATSASK